MEVTDDAPPDLTTTEAAALLGVSAGRVRQLIVAGRLPSTKRGRDRFIPRAAAVALRDQDRPVGRPVTTGAGLRRRRRSPSPRPEVP